MTGLDLVATWPELFVRLDHAQRESGHQTFAMDYLSDGHRDRAAVVDLLNPKLGRFDCDASRLRGASCNSV